jgi:excisionase family DNA binding protein
MEPQSLTAKEAARLLKVSRERIFQLLKQGRIAGRKTAGGPLAPWIVDRDSVLAFEPRGSGKRGPGKKSKSLQTQDLREFPETEEVRQ